MARTVTDVIRLLRNEKGYQETGNNHQKFSAQTPGLEWSQNQPWCNTFLSWGCYKAGLKPNVDYPNTASCLQSVAWFKRNKRWDNKPQIGDYVLYGPNGGTHVELVIGVSPSYIRTVGGNTSGSLNGRYFNGDGVYEKTVAKSSSRIYGYGRPKYDLPRNDSEDKKPQAPSKGRGRLTVPTGSPVLSRYSKGKRVEQLQAALNEYGNFADKLEVDGDFGSKTLEGVKKLQRYMKLKDDGVYGKLTAKALNELKGRYFK